MRALMDSKAMLSKKNNKKKSRKNQFINCAGKNK
jgi:hypothetical protein